MDWFIKEDDKGNFKYAVKNICLTNFTVMHYEKSENDSFYIFKIRNEENHLETDARSIRSAEVSTDQILKKADSFIKQYFNELNLYVKDCLSALTD